MYQISPWLSIGLNRFAKDTFDVYVFKDSKRMSSGDSRVDVRDATNSEEMIRLLEKSH
ncbi:MAG: hypothetical protein QXE01_03325 [Sulfolobales archaeon]